MFFKVLTCLLLSRYSRSLITYDSNVDNIKVNDKILNYYKSDSTKFEFLQKHFDICRKFPVECSNKCGLRDIPREKVCPITLTQSRLTQFVV